MNTISSKIIKKIHTKGRGWVFTPKDFLDIASRGAVDNALSRLSKSDIVRRIDKGIYDFPNSNSMIGILSPNIDDIANAVARKTGNKIFPSGAMAANLFGFSTQVPAQPIYLINGVSRNKKIGNRTIVFQHAKVPFIDSISFEANLALQALSYMGKNNVDDSIIQKCSVKLSKKDILSLNKAAPLIPSWMVNIIYKIQDKVNG